MKLCFTFWDFGYANRQELPVKAHAHAASERGSKPPRVLQAAPTHPAASCHYIHPPALCREETTVLKSHWTAHAQEKSLEGANPTVAKQPIQTRADLDQAKSHQVRWRWKLYEDQNTPAFGPPHQKALGALQRAFFAFLQLHFFCTRYICASWNKKTRACFPLSTDSISCLHSGKDVQKGFLFGRPTCQINFLWDSHFRDSVELAALHKLAS